MALHPDSTQVAVAWLRGVTGLPENGVATVLPQDNTTWAASGFVQVTVVGGTPDVYLPVARPVVQVDCWAVNLNSGRPPWGKAAQLAEIIRAACVDGAPTSDTQRLLTTLPAAYNDAQVMTAYLVTEPRRAPGGTLGGTVGDPGSYARITFDVQLSWREVVAA